jgi:hypothetical protein
VALVLRCLATLAGLALTSAEQREHDEQQMVKLHSDRAQVVESSDLRGRNSPTHDYQRDVIARHDATDELSHEVASDEVGVG